MHAAGLDALWFTTEAEVRYFTGFRTLFWQSPTRPWFLVVPRQSRPIAVVPEIGAALMAQTWVEDIRTWSSPHPSDDGVSQLASVLRSFPKVGMLMGAESSLRMSFHAFQALRAQLPGIEFLDASPLVKAQRMIKSEAEIAKTRAICTIASNALWCF